MSDIIQLLPDHVANQIAAGEVVQRPASVVKELLENAIDAGATNIKLLLKNAGKTLIQVIDNGKGMSNTDARMCFERHATSKILKAEDLFNLCTKGFRGEALASIAAIAHVELKTKPESEELGTSIKIEGSKIVSQDFVSTNKGTSFAVKNLFYNIPARRNFLKSDTVETRHIIDEFQRVALAHPTIAFLMHHNNNEVFHLKSSNLRKRIVSIFGTKMNEKLVPINEQTDIVSIEGFVAKPEFSKRKRGEQFFFVNDRFIKSSYLNHAVVNAFDGLLEQGSHPSYFLYLTVPTKTIDINIHPTKTEIKFDNEKALYAMLRATVKHSLGQYNVAPILDFNRDANLDTPYNFNTKTTSTSTPKISVDPDFNPFKEVVGAGKSSGGGNLYTKKSSKGWENLYEGLEVATPHHKPSTISFESEHINSTIFDTSKDLKDAVTTTFQLRKKYIITTIKSGMVVINQSRAHQRVLYEKFLKNITIKEAVSQQLLFPLSLSFSKGELAILKEIKENLCAVGFVFGSINDESVEVKGVPVQVAESEVQMVMEQLISDFQMEISDDSFSQSDMLAKTLSKTLSVKTGEQLDEASQLGLVNDLFACKETTLSPFNKRTYVTISENDIDRKFI